MLSSIFKSKMGQKLVRQTKKTQSLADLIREHRINFSQRYIANLERNRKMESLENVSNALIYCWFILLKRKKNKLKGFFCQNWYTYG